MAANKGSKIASGCLFNSATDTTRFNAVTSSTAVLAAKEVFLCRRCSSGGRQLSQKFNGKTQTMAEWRDNIETTLSESLADTGVVTVKEVCLSSAGGCSAAFIGAFEKKNNEQVPGQMATTFSIAVDPTSDSNVCKGKTKCEGTGLTEERLAQMLMSQSSNKCSPLAAGGLRFKSLKRKNQGRKGKQADVSAASLNSQVPDACGNGYKSAFQNECKPRCAADAKSKRGTRMKKALDERLAIKKGGGDKKGGDESGGDKKGGDESGGAKKGGDGSGGDKKGGDEPGGDKKGGDESGGDKKGGDESGGDKKGGDESGGAKKGGEESDGAKKGGVDGSDGDKKGDDKSGGNDSYQITLGVAADLSFSRLVLTVSASMIQIFI